MGLVISPIFDCNETDTKNVSVFSIYAYFPVSMSKFVV